MAASKCPVCGWDIAESAREVRVQGKVVTVCCDECSRELLAQPEKYEAQMASAGQPAGH
jgi:hypothetical protein